MSADQLIERVLEGEEPSDVIKEYRTWTSAGPRAGGEAKGLDKTVWRKFDSLRNKLFANWANANQKHYGPGQDMGKLAKEFKQTGWADFMQAVMYQMNKVVAVPEGKKGPGLGKITTRLSRRYSVPADEIAKLVNFLMQRYSGGQRD